MFHFSHNIHVPINIQCSTVTLLHNMQEMLATLNSAQFEVFRSVLPNRMPSCLKRINPQPCTIWQPEMSSCLQYRIIRNLVTWARPVLYVASYVNQCFFEFFVRAHHHPVQHTKENLWGPKTTLSQTRKIHTYWRPLQLKGTTLWPTDSSP
jgi:hypothetical protein